MLIAPCSATALGTAKSEASTPDPSRTSAACQRSVLEPKVTSGAVRQRKFVIDRLWPILLKNSSAFQELARGLYTCPSFMEVRIMMGQSIVQDQLSYAFNLEDHVPSDHLLRGADRFLDLGELRQHLAPLYSHMGRPSINPEFSPHAGDRLLPWHPIRTPTLRRSPSQLGLPLVNRVGR